MKELDEDDGPEISERVICRLLATMQLIGTMEMSPAVIFAVTDEMEAGKACGICGASLHKPKPGKGEAK